VLRDGGVIADGYDAELDELRGIQTNCGAFLLELEARERERTGIANLRVEYNRVHGFYIEVSRQRRQGARRLPPPPDAEERRALHHAGTQGLRGQGLSAKERALAREKLLYEELLDALAADIPACSASPAPWRCSTAWRLRRCGGTRATGAAAIQRRRA
jgi:DNA mismatch repair protein MutS